MFRLIQTSDTRGDCTASYDVQLDKEYTVKEFLETVLKQKADEWGAFYLMVRSKKLFWQNPGCEYKNGNRVGPAWASILTRYGSRRIVRACSDGGWTRMDYYIWLDAKDAPVEALRASSQATEKEENEAMIYLQVEDYCHGCPEFEAETVHESLWGDGQQLTGNCYVCCQHRGRCKRIVSYLEKEKNENSDNKEGSEP